MAPSGSVRFGEFYNGDRVGYTAGVRVRASEKLATTFSFSRDMIDLPEGVSFNTDLASLRVDASFSTRMFLNAYIQYNSVTRQWLSNIRFDFIHHPLSDIFIVYSTRESWLPDYRLGQLRLTPAFRLSHTVCRGTPPKKPKAWAWAPTQLGRFWVHVASA